MEGVDVGSAAAPWDASYTLFERARLAREAARESCAHAQAIRLALDESRDSRPTVCDWCGRYQVGDDWVRVRTPAAVNGMRHAVCRDCAVMLDGAE